MGFSERFSPVKVLFEDEHFIAAVKPSGLPTANAPAGSPSLFTWLKARLGQEAFVGVVSRLDAPVSGVVIVAKTPLAAARLAEQFRDRLIDKLYTAVIAGRFPAPAGQWVEWNDWLVRPVGQGPSQVVSSSSGGPAKKACPETAQDAKTTARVVRRGGEVSLVELAPVTGRRHQLRAQLAARGCPIVGDRLYGSRLPFPEPGGIALHATRIALVHPENKDPLIVTSECPSMWEQRFPHLFSRPPEG